LCEETLELHPTGVAIKHDELGNHFERFDGRKYVPNAEKRVHYPEDEAVDISII
jgi:F-box protein 21